ncbi:MAG: DUF5050 domain-containing protein [Lachnospiraceae bacterium]|nr:DUF5050 domain-containing protein [Lachnospiraceae bacterium]
MKKSNIKVIIFIIILVLVLGVSAVINVLSKRTKFNDDAAIGNTAGNINNKGLFAENDGRVYFSNPYDRGYLYSMNPDETDMKKIANSHVTNILAYGDYVYYYLDTANGGTGLGYVVRTFGLYRTNKDGKNAVCLDRTACTAMQLVGNYIYYQRYNNTDFTKTYKVKIDKSENELVSDVIINPAAADYGRIYFNGTEKDHYLYALDTGQDIIYTVYQGNLWYPQYSNGYVYYMDVSDDYKICRYSLSANTVEILTNDRADMFNVLGDVIYYTKSDAAEPALKRMRIDGSNNEIVAPGIYCDINLTSQYAYFRQYGTEVPMYHTSLTGPISISPFTAAEDAARNSK